jgi:hypothetical protein
MSAVPARSSRSCRASREYRESENLVLRKPLNPVIQGAEQKKARNAMRDHSDLQEMNARSLAQQSAVRKATFSPGEIKTLRPFSIWEISTFMFGVPADTLRKKLADDPTLPQGETQEDGRQRWFTLDEINELRRRIRFRGKPLLPERPRGRAMRVAVSNFKGGVGKTVVAQHLAHAAALDGYRVLCIDFDPQATLTHSMGIVEVREWETVWGIMCRDLCREADRITATYDDPDDCPYPSADELPQDVQSIAAQRVQDFIQETCWPTIDIIPSCAQAQLADVQRLGFGHGADDGMKRFPAGQGSHCARAAGQGDQLIIRQRHAPSCHVRTPFHNPGVDRSFRGIFARGRGTMSRPGLEFRL